LRTAGPTAGGVPVEAEAGPDVVVLDLGEGVWQVQASALGYWSPGAEVAVGREAPATVGLALWPAASLRGEIMTAGGDPPPRGLGLRACGANGRFEPARSLPRGRAAGSNVARRAGARSGKRARR